MTFPVTQQHALEMLRRRGVDPAEVDALPSLIDPAGTSLSPDEVKAFRRQVAERRLRTVAAGEFDLDRLPELLPKVSWWIEQHKQAAQQHPWLLLRGTVGSGKTTQLIAVLRELAYHYAALGQPWRWEFVTNRELALASHARDQRDYDATVATLCSADLVGLDDLGAFNNQDFGKAVELTATVIEHRYRYRLPTIYTVNPPAERTAKVREQEEELGRPILVLADVFDDRVLSRLRHRDTVVVTTAEVDYRRLQP